MKLVFEKIAELSSATKVNEENSEDENKENLNIQVKSTKRFSEVSEKEVRKRTCISNE